MIESIKYLISKAEEQTQFCEKKSLNTDQIEFCRKYFVTLAPEILRLSQGKDKTFFVLREDHLKVIGPDGKPMIVAARTNLGPLGPIEFHRDSVKTLLPTQVLFLMIHEFQHKSNFDGIAITDNDPIGPFTHGRDLIDAASESLVALARRNGKVGTQFSIRDIFDCMISTGSNSFGATVSTARIFKTSDLMSYNTSLGKNPAERPIYITETNNNSLVLKFDITEPNNCGDPNVLRSLKVQIIRATKLNDGLTKEDIISEIQSSNNPICPGSNPKFEISTGQLIFSCTYFGTQGTSSSGFNLKSKLYGGLTNNHAP